MLKFLRKLFGRVEDLPPVALVSLETTSRLLSKGQIARAVSIAVGSDYPPSQISEEGEAKHRFTVNGFELTFLSCFRPYIPKDRTPSPNLRVRDVVARHEAALLLDCWSAPAGRRREDATDLMGRILIELRDETTIGVYCFHTQRLNPVDDLLVSMFQAGQAAEAMEGSTSTAVSGISGDDPRMLEAIEEARRRWPEFVAAFRKRRAPDAGFGVKAPFGEGDRVEHLWIEVQEAFPDRATGTVMSKPIALVRPKHGDQVTVLAGELSDWSYRDGNESGGSFSETIVNERLGL